MDQLNESFEVVLNLLQEMLNAALTVPDNHEADDRQEALRVAIINTKTAQMWANKQ